MAASLFNGTAVKILKEILRFKSGVEIITNNTGDPTSVAVNAPQGSLYIRSGTDDMYIKGDSGSTTNWRKIQDVNDVANLVTGPASATDNAIVRYDLTTGKLIQNSSASISDTGVITAGADGVASLDLVTKQQLDASVSGVDVKEAVLVATTANITLSGEQTIDGVLTSASRVLVKNQTAQTENGVYVSAAGAWTRATDSDSSAELDGALVTVKSGTLGANTGWYQSTDAPVLGTSNIVWNQFFGAGTYTADGQGIELSGSTFSLEIDGTTLSKSATGLKVAALGVTNAEVSTTAGITRSKLASGTANRVAVNDASGVLSDAAAITASRALISDANGIPAHSAVTSTELGHVSGVTSGIQSQLDLKVSSTGFLDLNMISTSDRDAETSVGNWAAYADAAASTPVDMTGGTPNTTITRTITAGEILRGSASFKLTKSSGASRQGEGVSVSFTVPPSAQGKPVSIKIPFKVVSGSVVEGDFKVFIYDSTNNTLITPFNNNIVGISGSIKAQFISTSSASTPANQTYRVGIHIASATDSAVSIVFDDVEVVQSEIVYGGMTTDWTSFTPTFVGLGTVAGIEMQWRRDGDSISMRGNFTTGTTTATIASMSLPNSLSTAGTSSIPSISQFGQGYVSTIVNPSGKELSVLATASQSVVNFSLVRTDSTVNPLVAQNGNAAFLDSTKYSFFISGLPVQGWNATNPVTTAQQIKISNYLATGTRVTATAPTKLGEYRSYLRDASANTYIETNGAPGTAPTANDGVLIYRNTAWGTANAANQPTKYDIFVGKNKVIKWNFFDTAANSGNVDVTPSAFSSTIMQGYATSYDPTTGIATIVAPIDSTKTVASNTGIDETGAAIISNIYFDIVASEKINTVQFNEVNSAVHVDSGNGWGSTNTMIRRFTNLQERVGTDIDYADSATLGGSFTINTNGIYSVEYSDHASGGTWFGISLNSSALTTSIETLTYAQGKRAVGMADSATVGGFSSVTLKLSAGDVIRAHTNGSALTAANNNTIFRITRIA